MIYALFKYYIQPCFTEKDIGISWNIWHYLQAVNIIGLIRWTRFLSVSLCFSQRYTALLCISVVGIFSSTNQPRVCLEASSFSWILSWPLQCAPLFFPLTQKILSPVIFPVFDRMVWSLKDPENVVRKFLCVNASRKSSLWLRKTQEFPNDSRVRHR